MAVSIIMKSQNLQAVNTTDEYLLKWTITGRVINHALLTINE